MGQGMNEDEEEADGTTPINIQLDSNFVDEAFEENLQYNGSPAEPLRSDIDRLEALEKPLTPISKLAEHLHHLASKKLMEA